MVGQRTLNPLTQVRILAREPLHRGGDICTGRPSYLIIATNNTVFTKAHALQVCAAGILLSGNKILLGKRRADLEFYPDVWDIFGGHVENNETVEQTLLREITEELGVTPIDIIPFGVLHQRESSRDEDYEYHLYVVAKWIGTPKNIADEEHSEVRWFEIANALHLKLAHPKYHEIFKSLAVKPPRTELD